MNKHKLKNIIVIFVLIVATTGCEKWIDPEMNVNSDQPSDVTIATLIPAVEANAAFRLAGGNEVILVQTMWLQQFDGIARQAMAKTNYILTPNDIWWIWEDAYAVMLMDAKIILEKATEKNSPHNHGVGNILSAFVLGQVTDIWNDAPWRQALQGQEYLQPEFDSQEFIYDVIQQMLSEAIDSLSIPEDALGIKGDYLYDGDPDLWIKAAHAMKARFSLHLSKRKGDQAYTDALSEASQSFGSNNDDMQFNFGENYSESNPIYQFMVERNDIRMGAFFIDMLKSYNDPRIFVYAFPDDNDEYTGSLPGSGNASASWPGPAIISPDAPTYFITYAEVLFTKAECMFRLGNDMSEVRQMLVEAVKNSMLKYGVLDDEWMAGYTDMVSGLSGDELFKEIMTQKYIATFCQPEAYHSWRRTGIPELTPNPNGAEPEIPRRFPYGITEQLYNLNTPTGISITDRVWWDE